MIYSAPRAMDGRACPCPGLREEVVINESRPAGPLLRCRDLRVHFGGIVALDGVSFDVPEGQIVAIIGPNGAGKTTLFNCISRLYPVHGGDILYRGESLLSSPRHRIAELGITRTFQNLALFDRLSVLENVMLGSHCRLGGSFLSHALRLPSAMRAGRDVAEDAARLLSLLDLEQVAEQPAGSLPFGVRKRVELGRALAGKPALLLLDEPAAGLNHVEVEELADLIVSLARRLSLTVLLVEHHMNVVMRISDKIVVLDFGRGIAEGTPVEVKKNPQVIRAYLGETQ
jgi:branched-chain amino acid transport system ATP-binding protein